MTKADILELEEKLYQAMKNENLTILDDLLHDDLLFTLPSGQTITKAMDLESYKEGKLKLDQITPNVEALNIIDDLGIIVLNMELEGNYDNQPFKAKFKYTRFWKKIDNGIKVVGGSGMAI